MDFVSIAKEAPLGCALTASDIVVVRQTRSVWLWIVACAVAVKALRQVGLEDVHGGCWASTQAGIDGLSP